MEIAHRELSPIFYSELSAIFTDYVSILSLSLSLPDAIKTKLFAWVVGGEKKTAKSVKKLVCLYHQMAKKIYQSSTLVHVYWTYKLATIN